MAGIAYQTPLVGDIRSSVGLRNGKAYPLNRSVTSRGTDLIVLPPASWLGALPPPPSTPALQPAELRSAYGIMSPYWSIASASSDAAGPG
ncbi:hypothetical protein KC344_g175 [Hortaea werneckii]|nr:hypothetical protein KC344_g175 [Hortaea werneckii]